MLPLRKKHKAGHWVQDEDLDRAPELGELNAANYSARGNY